MTTLSQLFPPLSRRSRSRRNRRFTVAELRERVLLNAIVIKPRVALQTWYYAAARAKSDSRFPRWRLDDDSYWATRTGAATATILSPLPS